MAGPVTPQEALNLKKENIPDYVFTAFNELISENLSNGRAKVEQPNVVARILQKAAIGNIEITRSEIFSKGWLDVEGIYRKAGWKVEYDKPGYNESYDAYFVFTGNKG
jgi:hypothetical protein